MDHLVGVYLSFWDTVTLSSKMVVLNNFTLPWAVYECFSSSISYKILGIFILFNVCNLIGEEWQRSYCSWRLQQLSVSNHSIKQTENQ